MLRRRGNCAPTRGDPSAIAGSRDQTVAAIYSQVPAGRKTFQRAFTAPGALFAFFRWAGGYMCIHACLRRESILFSVNNLFTFVRVLFSMKIYLLLYKLDTLGSLLGISSFYIFIIKID